jgi:hypothetical protein
MHFCCQAWNLNKVRLLREEWGQHYCVRERNVFQNCGKIWGCFSVATAAVKYLKKFLRFTSLKLISRYVYCFFFPVFSEKIKFQKCVYRAAFLTPKTPQMCTYGSIWTQKHRPKCVYIYGSILTPKKSKMWYMAPFCTQKLRFFLPAAGCVKMCIYGTILPPPKTQIFLAYGGLCKKCV